MSRGLDRSGDLDTKAEFFEVEGRTEARGLRAARPWKAAPAAGLDRPVAVIGVFDGVHVGHKSLLKKGLVLARERRAPLVAVTFWPHPDRVVRRSGGKGGLLTTLDEKATLLRAAGAQRVLALKFTEQVAAVEPEAFFTGALVEALGCQAVVVGFNFTFGRGARGDALLLAELGKTAGVEVVVHPAVRIRGQVVSSSAVRQALREGDVEGAALLLGRPHSLVGTVSRGRGRGQTLGFPTANVEYAAEVLCPATGVYVCSLARGDVAPDDLSRALPSVANLGFRPTFTSSEGARTAPGLEVHVLAGEPPVYGERVRVFFHRRLRAERTFSGPEELAAQISRDRDRALAFFGLGLGRSVRPELAPGEVGVLE